MIHIFFLILKILGMILLGILALLFACDIDCAVQSFLLPGKRKC